MALDIRARYPPHGSQDFSRIPVLQANGTVTGICCPNLEDLWHRALWLFEHDSKIKVFFNDTVPSSIIHSRVWADAIQAFKGRPGEGPAVGVALGISSDGTELSIPALAFCDAGFIGFETRLIEALEFGIGQNSMDDFSLSLRFYILDLILQCMATFMLDFLRPWIPTTVPHSSPTTAFNGIHSLVNDAFVARQSCSLDFGSSLWGGRLRLGTRASLGLGERPRIAYISVDRNWAFACAVAVEILVPGGEPAQGSGTLHWLRIGDDFMRRWLTPGVVPPSLFHYTSLGHVKWSDDCRPISLELQASQDGVPVAYVEALQASV